MASGENDPTCDPNSDLLSHRREGDVLLITPAVDLTANTTGGVRQEVLALLADEMPTRVVFDMRHVSLCDSSGVAVFVETLGKLGAAPGSGAVWAVRCHDKVRGMIEICRLTTLISLADDESAALAG